MSTAIYTVNVKNNSAKNQEYLFFSEPPKPSKNIGKSWADVWVKTGGTPTPNGTQKFTVTTNNFAICGTTATPLDTGVSVSESDWAQVSLTKQTTLGTAPVMEIVNGNPAFSKPYGSVELANSFGITTKPFDADEFQNVYCGYGKHDSEGNVVPVAVWTAEPTQKYELTPVVAFYVSTGSYKAGDAVDVTALGAVAAIDFTAVDPGKTVATITHQPDGTYTAPVFTYPPTKLESMASNH